MVHIIYMNRSMCSDKYFAARMPEGHRGVPMTEHYKSNCNECFIEWLRFYDD